jgi:hypothetical protein
MKPGMIPGEGQKQFNRAIDRHHKNCIKTHDAKVACTADCDRDKLQIRNCLILTKI